MPKFKHKYQDQKIIKVIEKKLGSEQIIVDIIPIWHLSSSDRREEQILVISNLSCYFLNGYSYKKELGVKNIKLITLGMLGNELILHTDQDNIRIQSQENVLLIKDILRIHQKVLKESSPFKVHLEIVKSLQPFMQKQVDTFSKKFWGVFGKKTESAASKLTQRKSFSVIDVDNKNFVVQISQIFYENVYKNKQLIYISGYLGFMFDESKYQRQEINENTLIFHKKQTKQRMLMRRIPKTNSKQDKRIYKYLSNYKLHEYEEQILYALQTPKCFQILTLIEKNQTPLSYFLQADSFLSEIDIVSIFYKLMSLIDNNFQILNSLEIKRILMGDPIRISSVFCLRIEKINVDYLAPQQLDESLCETQDPQLINLWKIGMLIYEIAYQRSPFPIQYLAWTIKHQKKIVIKFPEQSYQRSMELQRFICQILRIQPNKRGGGKQWKKRIFHHPWIVKTTK